MSPIAPRLPSLRQQLVRRMLWPLALVWVLAAGITTWVANHFAQLAYDRSLLDDAYALAAHVLVRDGDVEVNLSSREMGGLLFDQSESVYFAVVDVNARLLAGHPGLEQWARSDDTRPHFLNVVYQNKPVRAVVLPVQKPARLVILIAQTTRSRSELLRQLFIYSLLPQVILLGLLAIWLRQGLDQELRPLSRLRQYIEKRDANDLTALPGPIHEASSTRDISQLAHALDDLLRKVRDGIDAQREFSGNVAHELRTPLAGIRALAEYGLRHDEVQVLHAQLRRILESQDRASHIVDQLLALAFATEAGQALQLEPIELDRLVSDVLLEMMHKSDRMQADLGAEGLDSPVAVWGHRGLIEGILINLIDNALKHGTQPGHKPHVTVKIERLRNPDFVHLQVCDEGPGLGPLAIEHMRARWNKSEQAGQPEPSHGLGLDIVHRYARLLNAKLEFTRAEGHTGLCVSLELQMASSGVGGKSGLDDQHAHHEDEHPSDKTSAMPNGQSRPHQ